MVKVSVSEIPPGLLCVSHSMKTSLVDDDVGKGDGELSAARDHVILPTSLFQNAM